jgi:uncharacterized protein DUF4431
MCYCGRMTRREFTILLSGTGIFSALAPTVGNACMNTQSKEEIAEGRLSVRSFKDGAGRPETAYILTPPVPQCLEGPAPEDKIRGARTVHVFSSNERVRGRISRFVGKHVHVRGTVFPGHTVHHHAPIVMDITEIDEI